MDNSNSSQPLKLPHNFIFVGYSIRVREGIHLPEHKPHCKIITVDPAIQPPHPYFESRPSEYVGDDVNPFSYLVYANTVVEKVYKDADNKEKYSFFGYGVHKDDILKYHTRRSMPFDPLAFPQFAYALKKPIEPFGEFLGCDIVDIDYAQYSLLTNMGIRWESAEKYGVLNQNHLFCELDAAIRFKEDGDLIEPSHAPYAVWGIYEVSTSLG